MRLRWTVTQREPTWRSRRQTTRDCDGASVPEIANAVPAWARRLSLVSVMLGTTRTEIGFDSSRPRAASPPKTARTWPLAGSCTLVAQLPSGPQAVVVTWAQAEPAAMYSTPSVAPAGEEPSAKRRTPDTPVGLAPFWLAALTVIAETGCENCAARARSAGSCA